MREPDFRSRRIVLGNTGRWLHAIEAGPVDREAPTVLMIHGAAGCWHNFYPQLRSFSAHYRVLAPDLRGHGQSPWPGPSTVGDFVDDISRLIDGEIPRPFELFGHSFGGAIAAHVAARWGGKVKHLALLNTGGHVPKGPVYRALQLLSPKIHWLCRIRPHSFGCNAEVAQLLLHETLKGWDCWDEYPRISAPTLVVLGRLDPLVPASFALRLGALLKDSTVHVLPSGGHVSMWESPKTLSELLGQLLHRGQTHAVAV